MAAAGLPIDSPVHAGPAGDSFTLVVHGVVEEAECPEGGLLYVRAQVKKGKDWNWVPPSGETVALTDVISQMSERLPGAVPKFAWNLPFDFVFTSSNPHGWPQIAISLMTLDPVGNDVVFGYSQVRVPVHRGRSTVKLPIFRPIFASAQHSLFAWAFGTLPELRDPGWLCSGEDREVMFSQTVMGYVKVSFDVEVVGLRHLNYE
jgi:B9 domain-containing protein 1